MSLIDDIRTAQIRAGEATVIASLARLENRLRIEPAKVQPPVERHYPEIHLTDVYVVEYLRHKEFVPSNYAIGTRVVTA